MYYALFGAVTFKLKGFKSYMCQAAAGNICKPSLRKQESPEPRSYSITFSLSLTMIPRAAFISSRGLSLSCRRAASTLVYLEHKGGKLNDSSLHALTAARTVDGDVRDLSINLIDDHSQAAVIVVGSKADVDKVAAEAKT